MPRVLLLDVMSTLVRDPFFDAMPGFFGLELGEMLEAKHPTAWIEFELAKRSEEELLRDFFADRRAFDHAAFVERITAAYELLPGIEALLTELADAGVPMYAFSNYPIWYERIEARTRLSRFLEWRFVSCETGLRKPDPAAYAHVVAELGVAAGDCVLVDDRERNCVAARAGGMDAIVFGGAGAGGLRGELRHRGLLP
jgi:FMN hydrolase / 5-amino-6-(5-phospho-D-ribitylamino)uracil phosphatase